MKLYELYQRSVVYPWVILLPCVTIYSIIENRNYESEWLTSESVIGMTILAAIVYGLIICLLALTMFLNKHERVRSNSIFSALSWFALPFGFICLVIGKAINEYLTVGSTSEIVYSVIFNLPFIIGLIWGFWKFRKLQRR
jgi:hypothetical protein